MLDQGAKAGLTDPDAIPEPPDEATTVRGDIWILGEHRLMCGDSSLAEDMARLLAGEPVQLVNTDPPYNVAVQPRFNNAFVTGQTNFAPKKQHASKRDRGLDAKRKAGPSKGTTTKLRAKDRPLANDFVSDQEFDRLLMAWFGNAARVLRPGGSFYIWGGYANLGNYPGPLEACGLYFSQGIVWDKQHPVLTRKDFMGAFEICFYGWKEGAGHNFYGPNNATDLWHVKKVNPQSMVHLTEKPVELAARAIQYSSQPGENVLDLFGGSGSTMIACEQQGRRGFLMELDPLYCDVIVQRWEAFTGKKAERVPANAVAEEKAPATARGSTVTDTAVLFTGSGARNQGRSPSPAAAPEPRRARQCECRDRARSGHHLAHDPETYRAAEVHGRVAAGDGVEGLHACPACRVGVHELQVHLVTLCAGPRRRRGRCRRSRADQVRRRRSRESRSPEDVLGPDRRALPAVREVRLPRPGERQVVDVQPQR